MLKLLLAPVLSVRSPVLLRENIQLRKGTIPAKDIADISGLSISEVSALAEELWHV